MKLTLSIDEAVIERAREVARKQGTSVNALIRQYLESLASGSDVAAELRRMWAEEPGHSGGRKIKREDAYAGRIG